MTPARPAILSPEDFERLYHKPKSGRTLVVGSRVYATRTDRRARYSNVVGIDMTKGPGVDVVLNLEETLPYTLGQFAHADCISVLEHSRRPWLLAANIERLLVDGGTLFVQAPFVWRLHRPPDYWRLTVEAVRSIFPCIEWEQLLYVPEMVSGKTPTLVSGEQRFIVRTEVLGFGRRSA